MARAEALIQMSIHGDETRGAKRVEKKGETKKEFAGRMKEICPLCDRVQQYLSTHLRRYHQLDSESDQYKKALRIARPYQGAHTEIQWDFQLNSNTKKIRRTRGAESDESDLEPSAAPTNTPHPIQQLLEELPSSDSDDDYQPPPQEEDVIPPSPTGQKNPMPSTQTSSNVIAVKEGETSNGDDDIEEDSSEEEEDEDDWSESESDLEEEPGVCLPSTILSKGKRGNHFANTPRDVFPSSSRHQWRSVQGMASNVTCPKCPEKNPVT